VVSPSIMTSGKSVADVQHDRQPGWGIQGRRVIAEKYFFVEGPA
jgi:hypothetical protein